MFLKVPEPRSTGTQYFDSLDLKIYTIAKVNERISFLLKIEITEKFNFGQINPASSSIEGERRALKNAR